MGVSVSVQRAIVTRSPCMIVTLDALGTLYRLKAPVHDQYRRVAYQCGLMSSYSDDDLTRSFKSAFKDHSSRFPNYGKANAGHGTLSDPQIWWENVVKDTFQPLVGNNETLPSNLGSSLYKHFSSSSAYELFPDVPQFISSLKRLRAQLENSPQGTQLITGIITNSDPRVRQILSSLGVFTGSLQAKPDITNIGEAVFEFVNQEGPRPSYFGRLYRPHEIDFDFLLTSYVAGYPKPDPRIFQDVRKFASTVRMAKLEQAESTEGEVIPPPPFTTSAAGPPPRSLRLPSMTQMIRYSREAATAATSAFHLHIGDDIHEDFFAALTSTGEIEHVQDIFNTDPDRPNRSIDALWLLREGAAQISSPDRISGTSSRVTQKEIDRLRDIGRGMIERDKSDDRPALSEHAKPNERPSQGAGTEVPEVKWPQSHPDLDSATTELDRILPTARKQMVSNLAEASAVLGMMVEERLGLQEEPSSEGG